MTGNLQSLCAQVEHLCTYVEEMLASPAELDRTVLQAKIVLVRDAVKVVENEHKVTELTYNGELGIWEPSEVIQL